MTNKQKKYLITFAVGVAFAIVVWAVGGLFKVTSYVALMGKISDGLFVSGVLLAGSGGLIASFNEGIFDGLSYGMHGLFGFRNIKKDSTPKKESYYDYQKRKHANKKPVGHLVFVGLSFVFVGVVFFLISLAI